MYDSPRWFSIAYYYPQQPLFHYESNTFFHSHNNYPFPPIHPSHFHPYHHVNNHMQYYEPYYNHPNNIPVVPFPYVQTPFPHPHQHNHTVPVPPSQVHYPNNNHTHMPLQPVHYPVIPQQTSAIITPQALPNVPPLPQTLPTISSNNQSFPAMSPHHSHEPMTQYTEHNDPIPLFNNPPVEIRDTQSPLVYTNLEPPPGISRIPLISPLPCPTDRHNEQTSHSRNLHIDSSIINTTLSEPTIFNHQGSSQSGPLPPIETILQGSRSLPEVYLV